MGRLGTREDIARHREYVADIVGSSRKALDTVDPTPYFVNYGWNTREAVGASRGRRRGAAASASGRARCE